MKKLTKLLSLVLCLAMLFSLAACASKDDTTTDTSSDTSDTTDTTSDGEKTVRLGLIGPMTGDNANYGTSTRDGAQIAVDEINEAGGVNGYTFVLDTQDSQGDPDSAVSAYGKLMDSGMNVSLGCVLSGEAQSVITAAVEDGILIVTPTSSAVACIEGNPNAFRVCFNDAAQGTASADYIADNNLGTKIAVFYQSDIDYSAGLYETFQAEAANRGLEIVEEQTFTAGSNTDFSTQINAIRDSGCELVFLPIYAAEAATFLTQAAGKLDGITFFGCDGMDGIQTKVSDTSLIEGLMMLTPFAADAEDAATQSFVEKYVPVHGTEPDQFAADGYDAVYIVKAAMEQCGKTPADADFNEAMVAAMYEIQVEGLTGTMTWDENNEPNKPAKAMVFHDGVAKLFAE
ncbi:MAG TPA: ABC transporter substrate-binding protein [Candidatus Avoscillospira stercoripullorum]|uniref:ABC transporter substrate-binding protein n=1 Tax=Candidatus Avoscillospira stercoripullorum TaxID=2840709 RepID=A0A9D1A727_9FIRM|nr:ABC transporter substrate-binding protein [Candidatus Avoscillospira stercoripullorum]